MKSLSFVACLVFSFLCFNAFSQSINLQQPIKFLAIGDDYTIATNEQSEHSWPNLLIGELIDLGIEIEEVKIFANEGWVTQEAHDELIDNEIENEWNLVSVMVGFNDHLNGGSMNLFSVEFTALLDKAISLARGDAKDVFVLSIPDYGFTPFGQPNIEYISENVALYNTVIQHFTDLRGAHYIDITESSQLGLFSPQYLSNDGLHPSKLMYEEWVEVILGRMQTSTSVIESSASNKISVYPNPTDGEISIYFENSIGEEIELNIYNGLGHKILSKNLNSKSLKPISFNYPAGIYLYTLNNGSNLLHSGKIIKR